MRFSMVLASLVSALLLLSLAPQARAGGVTIITHGLWSDVTSWIWPMAQSITQYPLFPSTNSTCYEVKFVQDASGLYVPTERLIAGSSPLHTASAEVFVKLDWSEIANLGVLSPGTSTSNIAYSAVAAMLNTNFFPEMGSRSIAELPIHLVGHSRGGSVVSEMAKRFGEQGIWIDQVTTLDPHPLNNDNFDDSLVTSLRDAPVRAWENILFCDNYWQTNPYPTVPNGEAVQGAFNRYVGILSGGYGNAHMNVHLWYHGTIDLSAPATDSQATITSAERQSWWTAFEQQGTHAGFYYSLIGRGNRLSTNQPAGLGTAMVKDGFNQVWDFGAGLAANRTALPSNSGEWPNIIKFNLTGTNYFTLANGTRVYAVWPGVVTSNSTTIFFQYGGLGSANAAITVYLGRDGNPYNAENIAVFQRTYSATGTRVNITSPTLNFTATTVPSGAYFVFARIAAGGHVRYLYAPELFEVFPPLTLGPPALASTGQPVFQVSGVASARVVIQSSPDLQSWSSTVTNALSSPVTNSLTGTLDFTDNDSIMPSHRFYRAFYSP